MKKITLSILLACALVSQGSAHIDLYGIYVRLSAQSFYCAMISTKLCARVSMPDDGSGDKSPWRTQFRIYNPGGHIVEEFEVESYTLHESGDGTVVDYILP